MNPNIKNDSARVISPEIKILGGSAVFKETKASLAVSIYLNNHQVFRKDLSNSNLIARWELNPPLMEHN